MTGSPLWSMAYGAEARNHQPYVDIDQGCVYGGYLTALRYPEIEFVQVRGKKYAEYHGGGKVPEE